MENFDTILNGAINRCKGIEIYDSAYDIGFQRIYPFTTENIGGYIDKFELKDKSLLTVGSSGDQIINAILKGSKDITLLDVNPYVEFYYYLKIACLLELDYNDFLYFLCPTIVYPEYYRTNTKLYNKETFNKIKLTLKSINKEAYLFWNTLFELYESYTIKNLFMEDVYDEKTIKRINPYLSSNIAYDETKNRLKNIEISFNKGNLFDANINDSYDNIWLSNIGGRLKINETATMIIKMMKYLNDDGMLLAWYQYKTNYIDIRDTIEYLNYVINELDKNILNCFTTDYHIFSTTANSGYTTRPNDSVLI